ncbi:Rrf2 family transcriptional regulator [Harenicola maris]|uniref:Rrf2 family transcriptional regulator n=1 Tax=Harenicola maris TaxID=2841044 RepID=UPI002E18A6FC
MHELEHRGYLDTLHGRGSGVCLARTAAKIVAGQVVRLTDGPFEFLECSKPKKNTYPLTIVCKLLRALQAVRSALGVVLGDLTMADIVWSEVGLLLGVPPLERALLRQCGGQNEQGRLDRTVSRDESLAARRA